MAGAKDGFGVLCPGRSIEIKGEEVAGFVGKQRIDSDHELPVPAAFLLTTQVTPDDRRSERQKLPIGAGTAPGAALITETWRPLMCAGRLKAGAA
jgi:hypothetical protein